MINTTFTILKDINFLEVREKSGNNTTTIKLELEKIIIRVSKYNLYIDDYKNNSTIFFNHLNCFDLSEVVEHFKIFQKALETSEDMEDFKNKLLTTENCYFQKIKWDEEPAYNPFKIIQGKIKIKVKKGHSINKRTIKKILHHKNTRIITEQFFTDDYKLDYIENYRKGLIKDRSEIANRIKDYRFTSSIENLISISGGSSWYTLTNKDLEIQYI